MMYVLRNNYIPLAQLVLRKVSRPSAFREGLARETTVIHGTALSMRAGFSHTANYTPCACVCLYLTRTGITSVLLYNSIAK